VTRRTPLQAELLGGRDGPSGWTLTAGPGAPKNVSLEALVCLERRLRSDGDVSAANDLYQQVTMLAGVAEAWRRNTDT
jgi:hypothetical protein